MEPNGPYKYTADDLLRYQQGTLSPEERHRLERAALEDPFLADALEGYATLPAATDDVPRLRVAIGERSRRKRRALPWWFSPALRVAALVLLLAGSGWLAYRLLDRPAQSVAVQPQQAPSNRTAPTEATVPAQTDTVTISAAPPPPVATTRPRQKPKARRQKKTIGPQSPVRTGETSPEDFSEEYAEMRSAVPDSALNPVPAIASGSAPRLYEGVVVNSRRQPVPQATLTFNHNNATVTDAQGRFFFQAPDTALQATVQAVGFEASRLRLQPDSSSTVVLQEQPNALNEVVVMGYGSQRKRAAPAARRPAIDTLEPVDGWVDFHDYIRDHIDIPDELPTDKGEGQVQLSFGVNTKGKPVNIRVERSLCRPCDEEAIRLLKEGPKWKKRKNRRGRVTIDF